MVHNRHILENLNYKITPVILAGGLGTRLRPTVGDVPKVLAPVNGRPFLSYLLDQLIAAGFSNVILCTGYKANMVEESFGENYKTLHIRYSQEREALGTGGALRYALPMVKNEIVLVMNGDSYIDADFPDFFDWYSKEEHDAAILLTKVNDTSRYGRVKIGEDGKIVGFYEKEEKPGTGWINVGVYLIRATSLFHLIPFGVGFSLERETIPTLIDESLYGYRCKGKFIDIGTPESYAQSETFFRRHQNKANIAKNKSI